LAGAKAISSDMFFGENADGANPDSGREHKGRSSNLSGGGYDEYKE